MPIYCSLPEEFGVCFVATGPQCVLCGNCMVDEGLDVVGRVHHGASMCIV